MTTKSSVVPAASWTSVSATVTLLGVSGTIGALYSVPGAIVALAPPWSSRVSVTGASAAGAIVSSHARLLPAVRRRALGDGAARHIEEIVLQGAEADARRLHVEAIPDGECGRAVVIGGNGLKARREPWA